MDINQTNIIAEIRKAIDDIEPTAADSFKSNTDSELWQAAQHAVYALLGELPLELLDAKKATAATGGTPTTAVDKYAVSPGSAGMGSVKLPTNFMRFASLKMSTWDAPVYTLIEKGSDEEKRQRSSWSRGTPQKPVVMLDHDGTDTVLRYWTVGAANNQYSHQVDSLLFIPIPTVTTSGTIKITCALKEAAEPLVVYRAASIFFEGKKEPETAEKFRNISM